MILLERQLNCLDSFGALLGMNNLVQIRSMHLVGSRGHSDMSRVEIEEASLHGVNGSLQIM
jgi:hypothetical protein